MYINDVKSTLTNIIDNTDSSEDFEYTACIIERIKTQLLYAHYFDISLEDKDRLKSLVNEAQNCLLESLVVRCITGFDTDEKRNAALSLINYMYHKDFHNKLVGDTFQEKFENLRSERRERSWRNECMMSIKEWNIWMKVMLVIKLSSIRYPTYQWNVVPPTLFHIPVGYIK